jgi:hypothetical protein
MIFVSHQPCTDTCSAMHYNISNGSTSFQRLFPSETEHGTNIIWRKAALGFNTLDCYVSWNKILIQVNSPQNFNTCAGGQNFIHHCSE